MEPASSNVGQFVETSKRFARRLLTIGENRFQLLMVEAQEARERLLRAILLALGAAALMVVGVAGLRRGPRAVGAKSGRLPGILNGLRLASAIWLAFRAREQRGA